MQERRPHSPAAERNRGPILEVLQSVFPPEADVLEVGAGTGQHAFFFTAAVPGWRWWPTNAPGEIETLAMGLAGLEQTNLQPPQALDAMGGWPDRRFDAVYSANTAHIMPRAGVRALFLGAGRVLRPAGRLVLYGPFRRDGLHTAPSNAAFDEQLRTRDPEMGIRDLDEIDGWADEARLRRIAEVAMPANNLILVFEPVPDSGSVDRHQRPEEQ